MVVKASQYWWWIAIMCKFRDIVITKTERLVSNGAATSAHTWVIRKTLIIISNTWVLHYLHHQSPFFNTLSQVIIKKNTWTIDINIRKLWFLFPSFIWNSTEIFIYWIYLPCTLPALLTVSPARWRSGDYVYFDCCLRKKKIIGTLKLTLNVEYNKWSNTITSDSYSLNIFQITLL